MSRCELCGGTEVCKQGLHRCVMLDKKFRSTNDPWKCRYEEPATRDDNIRKDHTLVKSLGALGIAGVPGATIWTAGSGNVRMDTAGWNWLRPLLEELKEFRDLLKESEEVPDELCG